MCVCVAVVEATRKLESPALLGVSPKTWGNRSGKVRICCTSQVRVAHPGLRGSPGKASSVLRVDNV